MKKTIKHEQQIIPAWEETVFTFDELTDDAKERVRQELSSDDIYTELFSEHINALLDNMFPSSNLRVVFQLSYCQGDGLNIEGKLFLADFMPYWKADEADRKIMEGYLNYYSPMYEFTNNTRYGYSCKFLDRRELEDFVDEYLEYLPEDASKTIIMSYMTAMIDCFEGLDKEWEADGYNYIYLEDDELLEAEAEARSEWYYEDGTPYYEG